MRLREVYAICKKADESWIEPVFEEKKGPGNTTYFILQNVVDIDILLEQLEQITSFQTDVSAIRSTTIAFRQASASAVFDGKTKNTMASAYSQLKFKARTMVEVFEAVEYKDQVEGFDIKMPSNLSLSEFGKCVKDLDLVFTTCPLFAKQNADIVFSAVDVGSVWLTFAVVGASALALLGMIAKLVDKAIVIRSHHLTTKAQEERVRALGLGNEHLESIVRVHKIMAQALLEKECKELAEENEIKEPEDIERIKQTTKILAEWMEKGLEIYAAVQAAPETKAIFPAVEEQSLPESAISLLTEGEGDNQGR